MEKFISFLLQRVYGSKHIPKEVLEIALINTIKDVKYHFPNLIDQEIVDRIKTNNNELALFLYRIGRELHIRGEESLKFQIHWLLKDLCSCEVYFNNNIDIGFYIVHCTGVIIGSRNIIGKGFIIHQGCTIGHKRNGIGNGAHVKSNVTMYCNSSILGEIEIGSNSIIGAHVLVTNSIKQGSIITNKLEFPERLYSKKSVK